MIEIYKNHSDKLKNGKYRKKTVWKIILQDLVSKISPGNVAPTLEQTMGRWKSMNRTYKKIKDHNNKSGNDRKKKPFYYEALDEMMIGNPNIQPVCLSSTSSIYNR